MMTLRVMTLSRRWSSDDARGARAGGGGRHYTKAQRLSRELATDESDHHAPRPQPASAYGLRE
jgi:hypothetical protein